MVSIMKIARIICAQHMSVCVVKTQPIHYSSGAKIRIAQFGLGPIGLETLKLAATKPWAEIVGGVDIDTTKIGQDLGALTGVKARRGRRVWGSLEELLAHARPQVIFHPSVSKFKDAFTQIEPMARRGI